MPGPVLIERLEAGSLPGEEKEELAPVYKRLRAIGYESMGKWSEAADQYREIVEMSPESEYAARALLRAPEQNRRLSGDDTRFMRKSSIRRAKEYARDLFSDGRDQHADKKIGRVRRII